MRRVPKPTTGPLELFLTCVGGFASADIRKRLVDIGPDILAAAVKYDANASAGTLFSISKFDGANDALVTGNVTKGELKSVYSQQMSKDGRPGRNEYEALRALAPGKKCPLCGVGGANTLDHYLPKSKFPLFSVLPLNLVPACRDCNTGKQADVPSTADEQSIHPYYDHQRFFDEQWLFAEVVQTSPPTVRFFAHPPMHWDIVSKNRASAHLKSFGLSQRFAIQVADDLSAIRPELQRIPDAAGRSSHLMQRAEDYGSVHKNSWQLAMYQALANSYWYCEVGFSLG
jgi:hypothetical protein